MTSACQWFQHIQDHFLAQNIKFSWWFHILAVSLFFSSEEKKIGGFCTLVQNSCMKMNVPNQILPVKAQRVVSCRELEVFCFFTFSFFLFLFVCLFVLEVVSRGLAV
ncbi:hypothetical protein S83_050961 [Arachis hypogaea]